MFVKHLIKKAAFIVLCAAAAYLLIQFTSLNILVPEIWFILLFFFLINTITYWLMMKSLGERPALLVQQFMKSMLIKFFSIIGVIAIYSIGINPDQTKPFVVIFILTYFINLIFEVSSVMKMMKNENISNPSE